MNMIKNSNTENVDFRNSRAWEDLRVPLKWKGSEWGGRRSAWAKAIARANLHWLIQ